MSKRKQFGWPEDTHALQIPGQTRIVASPSATGPGAWQLQIGNEIITASPSNLKMLAAFALYLSNSKRSHPRAARAHLAAEKKQKPQSEGVACSECGGDGAVGKPALCWPCRSGDCNHDDSADCELCAELDQD